MGTNCKLCKGDFERSPDDVVLCDHKEGAVHLGCCLYKCSLDGSPCVHALALYEKKKEK
jgi:hypothetical protein